MVCQNREKTKKVNAGSSIKKGAGIAKTEHVVTVANKTRLAGIFFGEGSKRYGN
jgi:hypothetical protein